MKKTPKPIKPDAATYFIAKRMENAGMLKPGQALMLAATAGLQANNGKPVKKTASPPRKQPKPAHSGGGQSGSGFVYVDIA